MNSLHKWAICEFWVGKKSAFLKYRERLRPTRVKDSKSEFDKSQPLAGMTGNERLFVTGLLEEFERAKKRDKKKAKKILEALQFDNESIEKIL